MWTFNEIRKDIILEPSYYSLKGFNKSVGINYYNSTGHNKKEIYFRKEYPIEIDDGKEILVSDIVDKDDNIILKHKIENGIIYSYEDPRYINDVEFSLSIAMYDVIADCYSDVYMGKYNINTKELKTYKTHNQPYEKNWQFLNNGNIIYSLEPFIILDKYEEVICNKICSYKAWKDLYGPLRLSTNPFEVNGKKYIFFHTPYFENRGLVSYYNGLMMLNDDYTPYGYFVNPFLSRNILKPNIDIFATDDCGIRCLYEWRKQYNKFAVQVATLFFMTVEVIDDEIYIYGGENDYQGLVMKFPVDYFEEQLKNKFFVFV